MNRINASSFVFGAVLACVPAALVNAAAKTVIKTASDLPRFSYPVAGSASSLAEADDGTFKIFSDKVRADLDQVLNDYEIEDKATLRELLAERLNLQELSDEYAGALQTVGTLRALEEKPALKLTAGLAARARVLAAQQMHDKGGFIESVPPVLHLPNLITVGAVDQAGDETSFTSRGDTVVVYADGYEVESSVPGGGKLKLSGTSMAAPNVVNLAAKLFALDPALTPADAIALIVDGSTVSSDGRFELIDERKSVALLRAKFIER